MYRLGGSSTFGARAVGASVQEESAGRLPIDHTPPGSAGSRSPPPAAAAGASARHSGSAQPAACRSRSGKGGRRRRLLSQLLTVPRVAAAGAARRFRCDVVSICHLGLAALVARHFQGAAQRSVHRAVVTCSTICVQVWVVRRGEGRWLLDSGDFEGDRSTARQGRPPRPCVISNITDRTPPAPPHLLS